MWVNPNKQLPPLGEHVLFVLDKAKVESHPENKGTYTCVGFFDGKDFTMIDAPSTLLMVLPVESVLLWKHMDSPPPRWLFIRMLHKCYRVFQHGAPIFLILAVISMLTVYRLQQNYDERDAVAKTMLRYNQQHQVISRTLQIAYRLNPDMADMCATIYQSDARRYGIEWFWFGATTRIESNFNTVALSSSEAKGLSQLLESTAAGLCRKMGFKYVKNVTVWEGPTNLRLGDAYIAEGLREGVVKKEANPMEFAIKRFLGGSKFKVYPDQPLIETYYQNVLAEYEVLRYIYKGVSMDYNL